VLLGEEVAVVMDKKGRHPSSEERDELMREVESLRKRIHRLRLEHDILNKANELLKKEEGTDLQDLANREKTPLIDALGTTHEVDEYINWCNQKRIKLSLGGLSPAEYRQSLCAAA
jgi:putative transposase